MKQILLSLLAHGMFVSAFAQTEPLDPCCNIIKKDVHKNIMVARDNTTGRLYQFRADAPDMKAINLNDAVNISSGKITAISGAKRMYVTVRPDPAEACCAVVSIQPDPAEACCAIVSFKNNATGVLSNFHAPKNISNTIKVGDPVYVEPINDIVTPKINNAEPINEFAIVQSSYGSSNGQMASYGYPATSGNASSSNAAEKWVINKTNSKSGTGKLFVSLPAGTEWDITIYAAGSTKVLSNTMLQQNFSLLPGSYDLEINHIWVRGVPVEKGNSTRLKTGILLISNSTSWTLYDEAKETVLINSTSAQKRGLPIGKYKLTIMNQDVAIEIKDGETVEY